MINRLFFLLVIFAFVSGCKDDLVANEVNRIAAETPATAKAGQGKIVLDCNGQSMSIEGECGGVTTMGTLIITVKDKIVPSRIFTISFNNEDYPVNGSTYNISKSDYMNENKKPDTDVYVGFSEVSLHNQMDWSSDDHSGKIKFTSDGDQVKCAFEDIRLQPSEVYNKGTLNQVAVVSGEFNLYKN